MERSWKIGIATACLCVALAYGFLKVDTLILSTIIRDPAFAPFVLNEETCEIGNSGSSLQGAVSGFEAKLKIPFYRAGYDPLPVLWEASGFEVTGLRRERLTGKLALFHDEKSAWVLVTIDTIGVPAKVSQLIRATLRRLLFDENPSLRCVVVNTVASHTHSGPDLTGLWGLVASGFDHNENRARFLSFGLHPLLNSLQVAVRRASLRTRDLELTLREAHFPNNRGPLVGALRQDGQSDKIGHEDLLSLAATNRGKALFHVWLWNGQAATEDRKKPRTIGDFPERIQKDSPDPLVYLPGVLVGEYPVAREGWETQLAREITSVEQRVPMPMSLSVYEQELCLSLDSLVPSVVGSWAVLWGADAEPQCPEGGPYDQGRSIAVRLTRLRFQDPVLPDLVLTPWEVSRDLQLEVSRAWPKGVRLVSLSDGFLGHALSSREWCRLGFGPRENCLDKPGSSTRLYDALLGMQQGASEAILKLRVSK